MNSKGRLRILGVIPARMASSRFPGKPLKLILGKPMIWHVWQHSRLSKVLDEVVIATCDNEIREIAEKFGSKVVMTSDKHTRSNDRVAEVAEKSHCDIVLNIQGDEPLVNPQIIDDVANKFINSSEVQCVNPVSEIKTDEDMESPHVVKVVSSPEGHALYFSRSPIPSSALIKRQYPGYRQVPIIGFRRDFCIKLTHLPQRPLEIQEAVDVLRILEYNMTLHTFITEFETIGVDTPADLIKVEKVLENDPIYKEYCHL